MDTTIFLAKLIEVFCLVMGASMLRRNTIMEVFRELSQTRAFSYVMGVIMLILGLLITLSRSNWENALAIVITLLGWGVLLEAMVFLFLPKELLAKKYINLLENKTLYYLIAFGYLVLGAYLFYNGFVV